MATPQSLGFFGTVFRGIGKVVSFFFIEKFGRNTLIIALILYFFLYAPTKIAINEKNPKIVIDVIMSKLVSADNGINLEVQAFKNEKQKGILNTLKSLLKIATLFWIFYFIGMIIYKTANAQSDISKGRNMTIAIVGVVLFQITGSLYIVFMEHSGTLKQDINYLIGEKPLKEIIVFVLNPIKGIWSFFANIEIYLDPFSKIPDRFFDGK